MPATVSPKTNRLIALGVLLPCAIVLAVAHRLNASPDGMGTHQQLGLPQCSFLTLTGLPCATCGMTTSFCHAAHGNILAAFVTQPFGAVLAITAAAMLIISAYALFSGMSLAPLLAHMTRGRLLLVYGLFAVAAWGYKAGLVMGAFS